LLGEDVLEKRVREIIGEGKQLLPSARLLEADRGTGIPNYAQ